MSGVLGGAGDVIASFGHANPLWLALALGAHLVNHLLRSLALRNVLGAAYPQQRVPFVDVAAAYATGVALNAVVPGRGGDVAKVALLRARLQGSSVATIAAGMSVLVLFDLLAATVLLVALIATRGLPFAASSPGAAAWLVPAGIAVAIVAATAARRLRPRIARLWSQLRRGGAILRTPRRYARQVVGPQAAAWGCRIGVVFCLLAAFGLPASLMTAALVMVLCGVSTLVPLTPGGAGTQQVLVAYALSGAGTAAVLAFSIGMQVGITAVNALLGMAGAMLAFRTLRPVAALRSGMRLARGPAAG
ncbi:MAG: YbhN family protein [Thermoleophilia bacterium]